jgi:exoribonuclease R
MEDKILQGLENVTKAKSLIEINDLLGLHGANEYQDLETTINTLVKNGLVHETKKQEFILMKYCSSLKTGKIQVNKSGNGFLLMDKGEDVFIDRDNTNDAINGDMVVVDVFKNHGKLEGKVIQILKRDLKNIVGEITFRKNKLIFIPDDERLGINITLTKESTYQCVDGHKVLVEVEKKLNNNNYIGRSFSM